MERAYDLVIRGGMLVDGSGAAPFEADVAVKDGRIATQSDYYDALGFYKQLGLM